MVFSHMAFLYGIVVGALLCELRSSLQASDLDQRDLLEVLPWGEGWENEGKESDLISQTAKYSLPRKHLSVWDNSESIDRSQKKIPERKKKKNLDKFLSPLDINSENRPRTGLKKQMRKLYESISDEILINTATSDAQKAPFVLVLDENKILMLWTSTDYRSEVFIKGQLLDHDLNKSGSEFQVSENTIPDSHGHVQAALLNSGHYVVVWQTYYSQVYARIMSDAHGVGGEFLVNTESENNDAYNPCVAPMNNGGFLIAWKKTIWNDYLTYKLYDELGNQIGHEIEAYSSWLLYRPEIAVLKDGGFIVAFETVDSSYDYEIHALQLDSSANPLGEQFIVNTHRIDGQKHVQLKALKDGNFVIAWSSENQDGSDYGIFMQMFSSSATKLGNEVQVNTYTTNKQFLTSVSAIPDGGFVVVYESYGQDGSLDGIFSQRFDRDGNNVDSELQINVHTSNAQQKAHSAGTSSGFVVAWQSEYQDGDDWGIYARTFTITIHSIALKNSLLDMSIYQYTSFNLVVPLNTFSVFSDVDLSYSISLKQDGVSIDLDNSWLSFDSSTRTFTGVPQEAATYTIQVNAKTDTSELTDEFQLDVLANSKPVLNSPIPPQVIPFNLQETWEYHIPKNTFKDLEGDPISYTSAFIVVGQEERALDSFWNLTVQNGKLSGIPSVPGDFIVRVYADDGNIGQNPTPVDIQIQVISQETEILELFSFQQRASKALIAGDGLGIWTSDQMALRRFGVVAGNPLNVELEFEYTFSSSATALIEINQNTLAVGDKEGNLILHSSLLNQEIALLALGSQISDICSDTENIETVYVSYLNHLTAVQVTFGQLVTEWDIDLSEEIKRMAKKDNFIYAATDNGIIRIDILTKIYEKLPVLDTIELVDIAIHESYLYTIEKETLHVIDIQDLGISASFSLSRDATSLKVIKNGDNILCLVTDASGITIVNASTTGNLFLDGFYESDSSLNSVHIDTSGTWGVIVKENSVLTAEIFKNNISLDFCEKNSQPCANELTIQAGKDLSVEMHASGSLPIYKTASNVSLAYSFTAQWMIESIHYSLPEWLIVFQPEDKICKLSGTPSDSIAGSVIHIEMSLYALSSFLQSTITVKKLISVSIDPRQASSVLPIPNQSLQVGNQWLFSFDPSTFANSDDFECVYETDGQLIEAFNTKYFIFTPSMRQWYINPDDSTKEKLFMCNPCDSQKNMKVYSITITAKNSLSNTDTGVSTSFDLTVYSERMPDTQVHPENFHKVYLDSTIFPTGVDYTVSLINANGENETLPTWISYTASDMAIDIFATNAQLDQDFELEISGDDNGTEIKSRFTLLIRNQAPVALRDIEKQRVKLGNFLDFAIPEDVFFDPDNDLLSYQVKLRNADGSVSVSESLPSWMSYISSTRTVYGMPNTEEAYTLLVYAHDNFGGQATKELEIETYKSTPTRNPNIYLENESVHIGTLLSFSLDLNLFVNLDGDVLSYEASQSDGRALPSWLSFDETTLAFFGTPVEVELLLSPLIVKITASNTIKSSHASFEIQITNQPPVVSSPINSQITSEVKSGFLSLELGVNMSFEFHSNTFEDGDGDILQYRASLSGGNPLPQWLNFNASTRLFSGTPLEPQSLSISVIASDGYMTCEDIFFLNIENYAPTLNKPLQQQFDSFYPQDFEDGQSLIFKFSFDTFVDEDDSLSYFVLFKEQAEGQWKDLSFSWVSFEDREFSGIVSADSINNSTFYLQVTASDGYRSVSDIFYFRILSKLPDSSLGKLHIHSQKDSIEVEIYTNSTKIALSEYGTVTPVDMSGNMQTAWMLEGPPSDINYILETAKYRSHSNRVLEEEKVTLKMDGIEQEYPISVFSPQPSFVSIPIPEQNAYISFVFSLNLREFYEYPNKENLKFTIKIEEKPSESEDWLLFESMAITGTPINEGDRGIYKLSITTRDEFQESSFQICYIVVEDKTVDTQTLSSVLIFVTEITVPVVILILLFVYRAFIYNHLKRSKHKFSPMKITPDDVNLRQLLILRPDEEEMAYKIFKKLPRHYDIDQQDLVNDLDHVLDKLKNSKTTKRIENKREETSTAKEYYSTFKECMENNDLSLLRINKQNYHGKYLFYYIMDLIYKTNLSRSQAKELNKLVELFKTSMSGRYRVQILVKYHSSSVMNLINGKDAWTVIIPDFLSSDVQCIEEFCQENSSNINPDVLFNRLKIEYWNDRAIRIQEISKIKIIKLFYRTQWFCKMKRGIEVEQWFCLNWLHANLSHSDINIEVDAPNKHLRKRVYMQILDLTGCLLAEMNLVQLPANRINTIFSHRSHGSEDQFISKSENFSEIVSPDLA